MPAKKYDLRVIPERFIVTQGKLKATFTIDDTGAMTFYQGVESKIVKDYHFEGSDPLMVAGVADLLKKCSQIAQREFKNRGKR